MKFVWNFEDGPVVREYPPGANVKGLFLRQRRPDELILTSKDREFLWNNPSYLRNLLYRLK